MRGKSQIPFLYEVAVIGLKVLRIAQRASTRAALAGLNIVFDLFHEGSLGLLDGSP